VFDIAKNEIYNQDKSCKKCNKEVKQLVKVNLERVRKLRKDKRLSQEDVAKILGFNTVYPYHRKESGQQSFTAEELMKLAQLYKVSYENFFIFDISENKDHIQKLN
jgi:putative transcriptional regulator